MINPFLKGSTLKGKSLLLKEQTLSLKEFTSVKKGNKNENGRVGSPETYLVLFLSLKGNILVSTMNMFY